MSSTGFTAIFPLGFSPSRVRRFSSRDQLNILYTEPRRQQAAAKGAGRLQRSREGRPQRTSKVTNSLWEAASRNGKAAKSSRNKGRRQGSEQRRMGGAEETKSKTAGDGWDPFSGFLQIQAGLLGYWPFASEGYNFRSDLQCKAILRPNNQEYGDDGDDDVEKGIATPHEICTSNEIKKRVECIKTMLGSMGDGEISVSAYNTAWVAMVSDLNGSGNPQFPSSLQWIVDNQLPDGSWGDRITFSAYDRVINTLACVIALTSWKIHPQKCQKGMLFIKENICKLEEESEEHMPIGFEVAFPSLIEIARNLDIEVPEDSPVLEEIYARRNLKLTKIPKDIMYNVATTLLFSLEGMADLEWEKLFKFQCKDGSFLFSPSSTAFALMQTKDEHCLSYLTRAVSKFHGGVPNVYPVDLFEHIWAVDRLQRLGISRYFQSEIRECVDYIYRNWTKDGICWAKESPVQDIDDTAMGFRVLRLHGYQVSPDVFKQFKKNGEFVCYAGQSTQSVTVMFNLFRASQVLFPGENILENAKKFSFKFLREKQSKNELIDKWIITKDLPGEVGYALDLPWYASLPRLETRYYLEQYGGEDDAWIGKTLYRMSYVNNNVYLELAKLDYNNCLKIHQLEWNHMQQWYVSFNFDDSERSEKSLLFSYYLAAANIFEPERSKERIAWAKTATLMHTIGSYFEREQLSFEQRKAHVDEFKNNVTCLDSKDNTRYKKTWEGLVGTVVSTLNQLALDALVAQRSDIHVHLRHAWEKWLMMWQKNGDMHEGEAELLVHAIILCAGHQVSEDLSVHPEYRQLSDITTQICRQISQSKAACTESFGEGTMNEEIEAKMQELVQLVLCDTSEGLDQDVKQTFLMVAKSFYYTAYCNPQDISLHISKVLFEDVV